jgi:hypothetical protein
MIDRYKLESDRSSEDNSPSEPERTTPLSTMVALSHIDDAKSASTMSYVLNRPDPSFVTHLIATAAKMPQTQRLRRATPEDAKSSYKSAADQNKPRDALRASGTSRVA